MDMFKGFVAKIGNLLGDQSRQLGRDLAERGLSYLSVKHGYTLKNLKAQVLN